MNLREYAEEYGLDYCVWKIAIDRGDRLSATLDKDRCISCGNYSDGCEMYIALKEVYTGKNGKA